MRFIWQVPIMLVLVSIARPGHAESLPPSPTPAPEVSAPRASGYVQVRETWQDHVGFSATLNRARAGVEGSLPSRFSYRVLVEYEAPASGRGPGTVSLRDAYIRWTYAPGSLWFGQFKTPFSREYITSITAIETADRATVVDTLATKRDIGVMGDLAIGAWATVALGVFNGEGQNANGNRDSTVLPIGRVTVRPIPQATFASSVARFGPDSVRWSAEGSFEERGVLVRAESIVQHRHARSQDDSGWFVLLGLRATPWLQLVGKQEDFQRPSIGASRRIQGTTVGANVDFPGGRTRLVVDWLSRTTGLARTRRDQLISQLQVRF